MHSHYFFLTLYISLQHIMIFKDSQLYHEYNKSLKIKIHVLNLKYLYYNFHSDFLTNWNLLTHNIDGSTCSY